MGQCPCFGLRKGNQNVNREDRKGKRLPSCGDDTVGSKSVTGSTRESPAPIDVPNAGNRAQIYSFRQLATATNNFRNESLIGRGGFGDVYKGQLESTSQAVAVKRFNKNGLQGEKEFLVEVLMLSHLHHPNLVTLIGYCVEGDERLLVYEYMEQGSLEDHLHYLKPGHIPLDWNTRMSIAAGAAKGLEYLHSGADPPVVYRDMKPSNILLGEGFHPKLSDFGLAKFGPTGDKSHVSTRVMGTQGYCAPEYLNSGKLTLKSDIYSFGVVLLELISGRKAHDEYRASLVDWALPVWKDGNNIFILADPLLRGQYSRSTLMRALEVALMCIHENANARPAITEIVEALNFLTSRPYNSTQAYRLTVKGPHESSSNSPKDWNFEREQAVAEAKVWGERWREKRRQSEGSSSDGSNR